MWRLVAENFENHVVHLALYLLINFHWCTIFFSFFNHSFIHLRFFFKHKASAMSKQLASVSLNMLATEGSDFNYCAKLLHRPGTANNIDRLGAA
jgi:hypothetical protein